MFFVVFKSTANFSVSIIQALYNGNVWHHKSLPMKSFIVWNLRKFSPANLSPFTIYYSYIANQSFLRTAIATVGYLMFRYNLKGTIAGTWEIFSDNLPAMVDNITPIRKGSPGFWVAGIVVRHGTQIDLAADKPWIRLIAGKV